MMNRSSLLLLTTVLAFACDPQRDDSDAAPLEQGDDEPAADLPLQIDHSIFDTGACKTFTLSTSTNTIASSCTAANPFYLDPDLPPIGEEIGHVVGVAECATGGNQIMPNGQPRCSNVCANNGKTWLPAGLTDHGVCLHDSEITTTPVSQQANACPGGQTKTTFSVQHDAQCGCQCSP